MTITVGPIFGRRHWEWYGDSIRSEGDRIEMILTIIAEINYKNRQRRPAIRRIQKLWARFGGADVRHLVLSTPAF